MSCSKEEIGSGVVENSKELADSSEVIAASQAFQASLSDFTQQVAPILKGKVHTRTNEDGKVEQFADLDSASLSKVNQQMEKLDDEGTGLLKMAGISDEDIHEMMGDSIDTGKIAIAAMIFSAMVHDDFIEPQTRSLFKNRYLSCVADALGIDGALFVGTAIKSGIKAAAKACLRLALTGATGAGAYVFAIGYAWCISGF